MKKNHENRSPAEETSSQTGSRTPRTVVDPKSGPADMQANGSVMMLIERAEYDRLAEPIGPVDGRVGNRPMPWLLSADRVVVSVL